MPIQNGYFNFFFFPSYYLQAKTEEDPPITIADERILKYDCLKLVQKEAIKIHWNLVQAFILAKQNSLLIPSSICTYSAMLMQTKLHTFKEG